MSGTKIVTCNCSHKDQDEIYGAKKRLANISESGSTAKCSVCGNKHGQVNKK